MSEVNPRLLRTEWFSLISLIILGFFWVWVSSPLQERELMNEPLSESTAIPKLIEISVRGAVANQGSYFVAQGTTLGDFLKKKFNFFLKQI